MGRRRRGGRRGRPPTSAATPAEDAVPDPRPDSAPGAAPDLRPAIAPDASAGRTPTLPTPSPRSVGPRGNGGRANPQGGGKGNDRSGSGSGSRSGNRGGGNRAGHRGGKRPRWMRQVNEFSAGGLVVDLDGDTPRGALIARTDRHGRLLWSLPKGHIEAGETPQQAAVREVEEETGIAGIIMAELGTIDFWFVAEDRRIHKTVQHYLMRATGGELSDADIEVTEVAWVPLSEIRAQLAYPDERGLVDTAGRLLADTA